MEDPARSRPRRRVAWIVLLALAAGPTLRSASADDEGSPPRGLDQPEGEEGDTNEQANDPRDLAPTLRLLDAKEAKPLAAGLAKAARRKDIDEIAPALDAIEGLTHESFTKPLLKLLAHDHSRAALRAAHLLAQRATEEEAEDLWKKGWGAKENRRRPAVRTSVLRAYGRLGLDLDKDQFADVAREWRWMLEEPQEAHGVALADICWFMGVRGDKRHALAMAHELDAPESTDPDNPATPPVEWWERRYKQWQVMHPVAVRALERLTGQVFKSRAEAQTWFTANEGAFGVPWRD